MRPSRLLRPALAVVALAAPVVLAPAPAHAATTPVRFTTALASGSLETAMEDLEAKIADHMRYGIVTPVTFGSAAQTPGNVVGTDSWGDSGLWTGVYLGGESLRYATARSYLQRTTLTTAERTYWTAQKADALDRVKQMLASEHRDINISASWTGTLKIPPTINTADPTGKHLVDFGGGLVHGEAGMMQRACTPKGAAPLGVSAPEIHPDNPIDDHNNRVYEITWRKADGGDNKTYWCETSPSRDTYAGVTFGLLTAFDLVSPDVPTLRHQITSDVLAMGDFLLKYGWSYPRPTGYIQSPGQNDFDGFFTPLMVQVPIARLNMANAVYHVALADGDIVERAKWLGVWNEELASQGAELAGSLLVDSSQPTDGYYKFNLDHLQIFNLLRTVAEPARSVLLNSWGVMDKTTRDDVNAHFEAITYAQSGDVSRANAAVTHLGQWLGYRANTGAGQTIDHSPQCIVVFQCVADDPANQVIIDGSSGPTAVPPGVISATNGPPAAGPWRALYPRPVDQRPPTDFLWQRPSTALSGSEPATYRTPGIDYLTPYWMLRYFTEIAPPAVTPIPDLPVPAFL